MRRTAPLLFALATLLSSAATARANPLTRGASTWNAERRCALSCHTTVPFMLAAPHLGAGAADTAAAIADRVAGRARSWPSARPWYRSRAAGSRGTEAVLNALVLSVSGHAAAATALENLWAAQRPDGGWDWLDFGIAPFETAEAEVAGAAFAALAVRRAPASAPRTGVARLERFLAAADRAGVALHERLYLLWAAQSLPRALSAGRRSAAAAAIRAAQNRDGGWSVGALGTWRRRDGSLNRPGPSDGYATGLAALVLAGEGGAANRAAVARARRWLRDNRRADGTWAGTSLKDDDAFNRELAGHAATAFALLGLAGR